ncbi:pirin family protein [Flammeovirga pectinis]|uniref:Pirin family protein n=1 Tax=Flammeovirga pectinis TaxID=2494373 RepID=A0A3Q9FN55_9BACT|nr:pirin family protein [Flammeovirga pectinis]AZQ62092.1 pirin family protein [Flammeovirga pectinis]
MKNDKIYSIQQIGAQWPTLDPFLFTAHHKEVYPKGNEDMTISESLTGRNIGSDFSSKDGWSMYHGRKIPGFPYHPHRGFETVTIVEEGLADHSDSLGSAGRFGEGDVQWMTAGAGVQHSEMFPLLNTKEKNPVELFQIWLNLPKKDKMVEPSYKMLWHEDIPLVNEKDVNGNAIEIKVIAGTYKNTNPLASTPNSWAADKNHNVGIWRVHLDANAEWSLPATAKTSNRAIYFYKGDSISVDSTTIEENVMFHVNPEAELKIKAGDSDTYILVLQGDPIGESVAKHGPFVMNTRAELQQAFNDFQNTQFGGWPWDKQEMVHAKNKGRFALHADGKLEEK